MTTGRLILTREQLLAEDAELRAQLASVTSALQRQVENTHTWRREVDTGIYRCDGCGMRTRMPREITMTCQEWQLEGTRYSRKGARPGGIS